MLTAASSSVSECQGEVNGVGTVMVAGFGKVWQAGNRSGEQEKRGRNAERISCMPACLVERGHRVNSDLRPS